MRRWQVVDTFRCCRSDVRCETRLRYLKCHPNVTLTGPQSPVDMFRASPEPRLKIVQPMKLNACIARYPRGTRCKTDTPHGSPAGCAIVRQPCCHISRRLRPVALRPAFSRGLPLTE